MRDVAIVSFSQSAAAFEHERNEVEILLPVVQDAIAQSRMERAEIGFTCSGSSDFLQGQPFAFVMALDAVGAWPPIKESHVEQDGAWALYEAWVKIQTEDVDSALVYGFGKSASGDLPEVLALSMDPYCVTPLWPDMDSVSAMQARQWMEKNGKTETDLAEIVQRNRRHAKDNPHAIHKGDVSIEELLAEPMIASPLREADCAGKADGASCVVLVAGDKARELCDRPVWIRGFDHRVDPAALGVRDLTTCASATIAAEKAGVSKDKIDFAELYAPYSHQEPILAEALGLGEDILLNPSGGALGAHVLMSCGLQRIGEAAQRIASGKADRGLGHATHGAALQQNLVCVLEGE
jgi:acetyl-CoA acetyltransferase